MRTEVITRPAEFLLLEDQWKRLYEKAEGAELHDGWEWTLSCLETLRGPEPELFVIAVYDGERCVGIAPLCIEPRRVGLLKVRSLRPINHGTTPYNHFLLHREYHNRDLLRSIGNALFERRGCWDFAELTSFSSKHSSTFLLRQALEERYSVFAAEAAMTTYVKLQGMLKRNKKAMHNIERRERGLRKKHRVDIRIDLPYSPELWRKLVEWNRARWKDSRFHDPQYERFFEKLLERMSRAGQLGFSCVEIDGEAECISLDFKFGDKIYGEMMNSRPGGKSGTGMILTHRMLEHFALRGATEFDFQEGDQEHKFYWTDSAGKNYHFYVCGKNGKSAYLAFCTWLKVAARQNKKLNDLKRKAVALRSGLYPSRKETRGSHAENSGFA
ncbi:GNAT family N-acetyltransferase [Cohnella cellulosilytica]|uniref:GNAT family N-acetyltransferase n=1 Tax=Cohnella cellulosilytica TaxID=986710 RepID=A0ABW2FNH3_9BACL